MTVVKTAYLTRVNRCTVVYLVQKALILYCIAFVVEKKHKEVIHIKRSNIRHFLSRVSYVFAKKNVFLIQSYCFLIIVLHGKIINVILMADYETDCMADYEIVMLGSRNCL